ncbi:MAG: tetratricopeptide repeat protein [Hyphomicrobiaceae bacterium]
MADTNDHLFREIEEEMRRERMENIWKKYGTYFFVLAAVIVLAVAGLQYYRYQQSAAANTAGAEFDRAAFLQQEKKPQEASKAFEEVAKTGPTGYATLARFRLAGLALENGDKPKALSQYEAISAMSDADPLFKSFAELQIAALKVGDADFTEVENRLNDLTSETSPWRSNARELVGLAALKAGKLDVARKSLEQVLADPLAPPQVRERAQIMMAEIIAADLVKNKQEPAANPSAPDSAAKSETGETTTPAGGAATTPEAAAGEQKPGSEQK